ncbi:hypothetical protein NVP1249A_10 [Vibrio phage 1.249.A._10N.261.55.B9]|uniref:Uncharacterized protein n=2 Tax=Autolykiviridae TaxID=2184034 RepID=A0A2I7RXF6_9VIRU|nr:hypothetical protein KMD63_gp10 [Vibrio phage 1.249.A._10N.261.55.B9]AUR98304.1 hypothetical protein NVP1249A_10 [Vibrio phage 1.249.A._10N.261.55.B9]AUR98326.1 hypothetical protein NVP1249B_10 [Vibrio phage 1.249.B._10N.261.55.B9]
MMPSKSQMITVAMTIGVLWAIHNVGALSPVKDFLNFDQ